MRYRQNQNESNTPEHAMGILLIVRHPSLIESRRLCSRKLVMFFPKQQLYHPVCDFSMSVFLLQKQFRNFDAFLVGCTWPYSSQNICMVGTQLFYITCHLNLSPTLLIFDNIFYFVEEMSWHILKIAGIQENG